MNNRFPRITEWHPIIPSPTRLFLSIQRQRVGVGQTEGAALPTAYTQPPLSPSKWRELTSSIPGSYKGQYTICMK